MKSLPSIRDKLTYLGLQLSRTQPSTRGDGNCMFYAISDQTNKSHSHLRKLATENVLKMLSDEKILWPYPTEDPSEWITRMSKDKEHGDDVVLQVIRYCNKEY